MLSLDSLHAKMQKPAEVQKIRQRIAELFPNWTGECMEETTAGITLLAQHYAHAYACQQTMPSTPALKQEFSHIMGAIRTIRNFSERATRPDGFGYIVSSLLANQDKQSPHIKKAWSQELKPLFFSELLEPLEFLSVSLEKANFPDAGRRNNLARDQLAEHISYFLADISIPINQSIQGHFHQLMDIVFCFCEDDVKADDIQNIIKKHISPTSQGKNT